MVQHDFPLEKHPYKKIAERLGISERECIDRLTALSDEGILREIRPFVNWKKVGFTGILIGMEVEPKLVDTVADAINGIPGVTHNYLRECRLNLWCTLTYYDDAEKERHLSFIRAQQGVVDLKVFASEKTYKIGLVLDV